MTRNEPSMPDGRNHGSGDCLNPRCATYQQQGTFSRPKGSSEPRVCDSCGHPERGEIEVNGPFRADPAPAKLNGSHAHIPRLVPRVKPVERSWPEVSPETGWRQCEYGWCGRESHYIHESGAAVWYVHHRGWAWSTPSAPHNAPCGIEAEFAGACRLALSPAVEQNNGVDHGKVAPIPSPSPPPDRQAAAEVRAIGEAPARSQDGSDGQRLHEASEGAGRSREEELALARNGSSDPGSAQALSSATEARLQARAAPGGDSAAPFGDERPHEPPAVLPGATTALAAENEWLRKALAPRDAIEAELRKALEDAERRADENAELCAVKDARIAELEKALDSAVKRLDDEAADAAELRAIQDVSHETELARVAKAFTADNARLEVEREEMRAAMLRASSERDAARERLDRVVLAIGRAQLMAKPLDADGIGTSAIVPMEAWRELHAAAEAAREKGGM